MFDPNAAVERVCDALARGELTRDDLTARRVTSFLGQSTIALYHHFDSLDGMLIQVDGAGWKRLLSVLSNRVADGGSAETLAMSYLDFAFEHPHLYWLMSQYPFDREALKAKNRLRQGKALWDAFARLVALVGSSDPEADTRLLMASLHGLVVLHESGRADLGQARARRGHEATREAARRLVSVLFASSAPKERARP